MFPILRVQDGQPKNFFAMQKALLKLVGIDLDAVEKNAYRLIHPVIVLLLIISYFCIELMELLNHLDDFDVVTNITLHLIGFSMGVLKAFVLFYNRKKLERIFEAMEAGASALDNGGLEAQLIKRCILQSNVQTTYCLGPLYLVFVVSATATVLRRVLFNTSKLPFTQLTVVDVTSNGYYVIMWLHQTIVFILAAAAYLSAEVLIAAVSAHLCIQCKILKTYIKQSHLLSSSNIIQRQSERSFSNTGNVNVHREDQALFSNTSLNLHHLKQIVIRHMKICNLAKQIQEAFQTVLLIMLASDVLIICFSAFHASLFPLNDMQCLRDIGIALSIISKDLIVCYWGNQVCLESQTIAAACYEIIHFGEENLSFYKGLLLVMLRSQKPIIITAGKFTPLSLDTFIWIVRTSYSYFAVLRSRNLDY